MKIEFYHIDAFEVANYEPIWRQLRELGVDARLVAVPDNRNTASAGWFDFDRFKSYCTARDIPFSTSADPSADIGVTTQNANILRDYKRRVRLMYGPVIYPEAWALQPHSVQPFDAVLVHGKAYAERFAKWLPLEKLPIIGYPRYDDFFAGKLKRDEIHARWGIGSSKPVLGFLPTWGDNTGFEKFFPALIRLADRYQIILRPHHCTLRGEPQRMTLMQSSGFRMLESAFDLAEFYAGVDVVLSDVRSGGLFEACLCDVPVVGMVVDPAEITGWLAQNNVGQMAGLCLDPNRLEAMLEEAMSSKTQAAQRQSWAEEHVAFRDGTAAQRAAEVLIKLAIPAAYSVAAEPKAKQTYPVKVSIVLPTYNHARYLPGAVQAIMQQTFGDFELIIINDGSTDETANMFAEVRHPKLRFVTQKNHGLPAALNNGFALARGEYWTWTSADNITGPTWLEELVKALDESPDEVGYALSSFAYVDEQGQILGVSSNQRLETWKMLVSNSNASFLYRAELGRLAGPYDTGLNGAEDMDMWVRMSQLTRAVFVESVLYYYRVHANTMTQQMPDKVRNATQGMIDKFLAASGGHFDVDRIFSGIRECADPALARWQARVWLASRLANSPFCPPSAIVGMLTEALRERYDPGLVGNIVHIFAKANAWDSAGQFVALCAQQLPSEFLQQLADIITRRDRDALAKIPFVSIADQALIFDRREQLSRARLNQAA